MNKQNCILYPLILLLFATTVLAFQGINIEEANCISYRVDPKKQKLQLYWKDNSGQTFKSLGNLKNWLAQKNQELVFAMNAGMYKEDNVPLGLFIQQHKIITALNKRSARGNFYLKPNGVLAIATDNSATICKTEAFNANGKIKYATQSGPMLVIDGAIHPAFTVGSTNLNIRNGVGILPNNELIFGMTKTGINFYDFANYFKKLGCKNALYLDGFVSRTYLPQKDCIQLDGNFGVIVGVAVDMK